MMYLVTGWGSGLPVQFAKGASFRSAPAPRPGALDCSVPLRVSVDLLSANALLHGGLPDGRAIPWLPMPSPESA